MCFCVKGGNPIFFSTFPPNPGLTSFSTENTLKTQITSVQIYTQIKSSIIFCFFKRLSHLRLVEMAVSCIWGQPQMSERKPTCIRRRKLNYQQENQQTYLSHTHHPENNFTIQVIHQSLRQRQSGPKHNSQPYASGWILHDSGGILINRIVEIE